MREVDGLVDLMVERVAGTGILETMLSGTARVSGRMIPGAS
jgi:hypothetical protein